MIFLVTGSELYSQYLFYYRFVFASPPRNNVQQCVQMHIGLSNPEATRHSNYIQHWGPFYAPIRAWLMRALCAKVNESMLTVTRLSCCDFSRTRDDCLTGRGNQWYTGRKGINREQQFTTSALWTQVWSWFASVGEGTDWHTDRCRCQEMRSPLTVYKLYINAFKKDTYWKEV